MRRASLAARLIAVAAILVLAGGVFSVARQAQALPNASKCSDWGNDTLDRVQTARQLLYPPERQEQSTGSVQGDAQALYQLAQDVANSNPPEEGQKLAGDLVEALSAASAALSGSGGGASPDAQIAFAKAIVYNADLRLAYLLDHC